MTLSTSTLAYDDCYAVMDAALGDEKGAGVRFPAESDANIFRMRCHYARKIDRTKNAETYEKGHALHGVSAYDRLIVRVRENGNAWWVLIEPNAVAPETVVSLSTGEPLTLNAAPRPLALPSPATPPGIDPDALPVESTQAIASEPEPAPKPKTGLRRL